jgi:type IV secretory pathway VirB2 component (pilin)
MKFRSSTWRRFGPALLTALLCCGVAHAQLPWEQPLTALQNSLTGTVAKSIGVIAMAISGGMLAFGGELNEFTKRIMMVVLALSVMLLASNFVSALGLP